MKRLQSQVWPGEDTGRPTGGNAAVQLGLNRNRDALNSCGIAVRTQELEGKAMKGCMSLARQTSVNTVAWSEL
jgi:hypothetical protein